MIKECRFMEDAHLSAAGSQASIPPTIDFHRVRRVSCPPFRAICFPTIEIINGTTETLFRADHRSFLSFRCEFVYLFLFARKIIIPRSDVDR